MPGSGSGLARDYALVQRLGWKFVLPALRIVNRNVSSVRRSGRALARLATHPDFADAEGRYFDIEREARSSAVSYDEALADRLYADSARLVDL